MKKLLLFIALCILIPSIGFNQNDYNFYHDAKVLDSCKSSPEAYFKTLANYVDTTPTIANIQKTFKKNPFFTNSDKFTLEVSILTHNAWLFYKDTLNTHAAITKDTIALSNIEDSIKTILLKLRSSTNPNPSAKKDTLIFKKDTAQLDSLQKDLYLLTKLYPSSTEKGNKKAYTPKLASLPQINLKDTLLDTLIKHYQKIHEVINKNKNLYIDTIQAHIGKLKELIKESVNKTNYFKSLDERYKDSPLFETGNAFIQDGITKTSFTPSPESTATSGSLQTDILNGTADYISERFKQEIALYFFQVFRDSVDNNATLRILFPQTTQLFDINDPYNFTNKTTILQNSLQNDLSNLVPSIDSLLSFSLSKKIQGLNLNNYNKKDLSGFFFNLTHLDTIKTKLIQNKLDTINKLLSGMQATIKNKNYYIRTSQIKTMPDSLKKIYTAIIQAKTTTDYTKIKKLLDSVVSYFSRIEPFMPSKKNMDSIKGASIAHYLILSQNFIKESSDSLSAHITKNITILRMTEAVSYLHTFLILYNELQNQNTPADIIETLGDSSVEALCSFNPNIRSSMQLIYRLSRGLRHVGNGEENWINYDSLRNMTNGQFSYFMALIYQKIRDIEFFNKTGTPERLDSLLNKDKNKELAQYIISLSKTLSTIENSINEFRDKKKQGIKLTATDYTEEYQALLSMVEIVFTSNILSKDNPVISKDVKKLVALSNRLLLLYSDINQQNYTAILGDGLYLMQNTLGNSFPQSSNVLKYGTFITALASAKNSNDVKQAIQNIALPPGSYSIKRNSIYNFCLNAYVGADFNHNFFYGNNSTTWNDNVGLTTPIGIAYSWGNRSNKLKHDAPDMITVKSKKNTHKKKYLTGRSTTLFISIIDIGYLTQIHLNNSQNTIPSQVTFSQFFAPGIYYFYGFRRCPFSAFFGVNYRPQLATEYETGTTASGGSQIALSTEPNQVRFNWGVAVDLPILNFATKRGY